MSLQTLDVNLLSTDDSTKAECPIIIRHWQRLDRDEERKYIYADPDGGYETAHATGFVSNVYTFIKPDINDARTLKVFIDVHAIKALYNAIVEIEQTKTIERVDS